MLFRSGHRWSRRRVGKTLRNKKLTKRKKKEWRRKKKKSAKLRKKQLRNWQLHKRVKLLEKRQLRLKL